MPTDGLSPGQIASAVLLELGQQLFSCVSDEGWAGDVRRAKQSRIAARRTREALQLFGPRLQPKTAKQLVRNLTILTAPLDDLREIDVTIGFLTAEVERYPSLQSALDSLQSDRKRASARAMRRASPARVRQFASRLRRYAASAGHRSAEQGATLDGLLRARYQRVLHRAEQMDLRDLPSLHALRRAVRRLRYDLEALGRWLGAIPELLAHAKSAQDHLGAVTDREAMLALLVRLASVESPEMQSAIQELKLRLRRELDELVAGTPKALGPLLGEQYGATLRAGPAVAGVASK